MTDHLSPAAATDAQIARARVLPTATLFESNRQQGALPSAIKPVATGFKLCGRAFTVQSPAQDNLWLHKAIYAAAPGDILVVHVSNHYEAGYWGEIMAKAALVRKLGGLVIDGCVRDRDLLEEFGFPVFARGLCIRGTGKDREARGKLGQPIVIGTQDIHQGDLIVGDADGVVCVRADWIDATLDRADAREAKEADILKRLEAGESTLDIYNFH